MKYKRKPAVVEAFRFDADAEITAPEWFMKEVEKEKIFIDRSILDGAAHIYGCTVYAKSGKMKAKVGDYIIRDPIRSRKDMQGERVQRGIRKDAGRMEIKYHPSADTP